MTLVDTTLYCNGELRLAKHGPRGGGTVLMHVPSGRQIDDLNEHDERTVNEMARLHWRAGPIFDMVGFNVRNRSLGLPD